MWTVKEIWAEYRFPDYGFRTSRNTVVQPGEWMEQAWRLAAMMFLSQQIVGNFSCYGFHPLALKSCIVESDTYFEFCLAASSSDIAGGYLLLHNFCAWRVRLWPKCQGRQISTGIGCRKAGYHCLFFIWFFIFNRLSRLLPQDWVLSKGNLTLSIHYSKT